MVLTWDCWQRTTKQPIYRIFEVTMLAWIICYQLTDALSVAVKMALPKL